ncbi:O-antigen ligase family protein [Candidatus Microgenomates bacterium]|nr:O-antigen ligase family protein [Candidatus Microgenomates bacterium]
MVKTLFKSKKIAQTLLFILLVVFPFGQIIKIGYVNVIDVVVGTIAVFTMLSGPIYPKWYRYIAYFLLFGLFSWAFNAILLSNGLIFKGFLYLFRLFTYSLLPVFIANNFVIKENNLKTKEQRKKIVNSLLVVVMVAAVFGWLQYFLLPDTRSFKILGWDDHYFRLIGSFLDPTFTAIILVLGAILAAYKRKRVLGLFFLTTLAFTYSRAGYLALLVSILYFSIKKHSLKLFLFPAVIFLILISMLPKSVGGEGVKLTRTSTVSARLINFRDSTKLILNSPVIGVGLNNICPTKLRYEIESNPDSHSCFGLDSSVLFLFATTGVLGTMILGYAFLQIKYSEILFTSFLAVLAHSFFSNSLFYPHVMVWLWVLVGLGSEVNVKRS